MQTEEALIEFLTEQGFRDIRRIGGVLCGLHDYITTRAIVVGLTAWSYERRYCYQNRAEADAAFAVYEDVDQHPGGMWIKVKGSFRGQSIDALNPQWPEIRAFDTVAPV